MTHSVLIVDADQGFTEAAANALETRGIVVHVRDDAPIELLRRLRPSLMVVNVELPKGATTGLSICSRVRRDRELNAMVILLTTQEASDDMLKKHAASTDRANDYARKPLALEDMLSRIERLLDGAPPGGTGDLPTLPEADREVTSSGTVVPPSLRREIPPVTASTNPEDLWRPMRLDEALRAVADIVEPQTPTKPTPEERLAFMRQLVKYYETRDKAFRETWDRAQALGQELARRSVYLAGELATRERRLEELGTGHKELEQKETRAKAELAAFQEEITRIFRDKDAEEAQVFKELTALEAKNVELTRELEQARAVDSDHQRRIQIYQDELEELNGEKENTELQIVALRGTVEEFERSGTELRSRLETTDAVARERADEIEKLRERMDQVTLEANAERTRIERAHNDALVSMTQRHAETLEALTRSQETEVQTLEIEKAELLARTEDLTESLQASVARAKAVEQQLQSALQGHANERKANAEQIRILEESVEEIQSEAFERLAEIDRLKKREERQAARIENLDTSLRISEQALEASDATAAENEAKSRRLLGRLARALKTAHTALAEEPIGDEEQTPAVPFDETFAEESTRNDVHARLDSLDDATRTEAPRHTSLLFDELESTPAEPRDPHMEVLAEVMHPPRRRRDTAPALEMDERDETEILDYEKIK